MPELPERIVDQNEADDRTATDRATRRRMEKKGAFPPRFEITPNGATGYLESEVAAWIAARAAERTPSTKTAVASAVLAERRRAAAGLPQTEASPGADIEEQPLPGTRRGRTRQAETPLPSGGA